MSRREKYSLAQRKAAAAELIEFAKVLGVTLAALGEMMFPGKPNKIYSFTRKRAIPTDRDTESLLKAASELKSDLDISAKRRFWSDLRDGRESLGQSMVLPFRSLEFVSFIEEAFDRLREFKDAPEADLLALLANRVTQRLGVVRHGMWAPQDLATRVLFYSDEAVAELENWMATENLPAALWSMIRVQNRPGKFVIPQYPLPAVHFFVGAENGEGLQPAVDSLAKELGNCYEKEYGKAAPEGLVKLYLPYAGEGSAHEAQALEEGAGSAGAEASEETNTLIVQMGLWVFSKPKECRATLNQDCTKSLGDFLEGMLEDEKARWGHFAHELPQSYAIGMLERRGIRWSKVSGEFLPDDHRWQ